MAFAHLHTHTEYSLLDGSNKIKEYIARVKELGMTSAAITDHGVMYGVIDFYKEAMKQGIHPVLGCEVYVAPGSRLEKTSRNQERYYHLILLAENDLGYHNLMKIVSIGFTEGYYYKPRVDMETLSVYHEGIICLSACLAGEVPRRLAAGQYDEAREAALRHLEIFGEGNYFLELQDHGQPEQKAVNSQLLRLSKETGIPLVVTNDCHYTYETDVDAHDILLCLQTGKKLEDEDRMRYEGGQYYVKSEEEMRALFPYVPDAVERTQEIAARCNVNIVFHESKLPAYPTPAPYTSEEYLNLLCEEGFRERYPDADDALWDRLKYELSVIKRMGYIDYFLIVWDFISYARSQGIAVGPGRGSAAGSVVSYSLKITNIDPIKYDLIFERFLNPERVSMPDIDVDFCVDRRGEVIDYVMEKYGKDHVVQIITFGTMAARGVIRDVGRVMGLPYSYAASVAKMVPQELDITLEKAMEQNRDLKKLYETDETARELIDMSKRLEGLPRNSSMHAAGVVISKEPMNEYVPLSRAQDGTITTQFTMTTIEELGLLKMDFLGLRNLTVIQNTTRLIAQNRGIEIDIDAIDMEDPAVYAYISSGKLEGVFQLESKGMKSFMKELKPACLEDIIAGIALYRPGPMDFIPAYIKGKNHPEEIVYDTPLLEPILKDTYGCIVYQEQVMRIVRDLAGFTLGRSDLLRRAMSKKKADVMQKERQNFVYGNEAEGIVGCIGNGISEQVANKIYDNMIDFAKYAFNKSHAAAYAFVTYQTAWLKYYYPVEYLASLMTSVIDNLPKVSEYIQTAIDMGITVLPPDINAGEWGFSVRGNTIIYGLCAIRAVGRNAIDAIVRERQQNGNYKSLEDFCRRNPSHEINKRAVEGLIKAGAFDSLGGNRRQYLLVYTQLMDAISAEKKNSIPGQLSFFDLEEDSESLRTPLPQVDEFDLDTILEFEKEVLGLYISGHPLDAYRSSWSRLTTASASDLRIDEETGRPSLKPDERVTIGGIITSVTHKTTRKNQAMAFLTIEDLADTAEVIVFPNVFDEYRYLLEEDEKILVSGRVTEEEDEKDARLIAEKMCRLSELPKRVWVQFADRDVYRMRQADLEAILRSAPGSDEVVVYLRKEKQMKRMGADFSVKADDGLKEKLTAAYGAENVRLVDITLQS